MLTAEHEALADLFFRLIADHGRFNSKQLWRFVELKTGAAPDEDLCAALISYAVIKGAKREDCEAPVYAFKVRRQKRQSKRSKGLAGQLAFEGPLGETRAKPKARRKKKKAAA